MTITPELKQAIEQAGSEPVRLTDPATNDAYYLLKEDLFDRLKSVFEDSLDMHHVGALVDEAMRDQDPGDPLLNSYQQYRS